MQTKDFFKCQTTLGKLDNCGFLSTYLDDFADWLSKLSFAWNTVGRHLTNIAHFSHYLKQGQPPNIQSLNPHFDIFLYEHIPNCHCIGWNKVRKSKRVSLSLNRFKKYLTDCHGINFENNSGAYSAIHDEYLLWLSRYQGLTKSTIKSRSNYLRQFLEWYSDESASEDLRETKADDVERFFLEATSKWGRAYKFSLQATLRSFFDFCYDREHTPQNLRSSIPTIMTYRLSSVPKAIEDNEALKLLKSIDHSKKSGIRNYAILLLLFTYGVRGGQISALKLKDINWHKEEICFPALKGGKHSLDPLTAEAGNALLDYLQNVRGKSHHQEVFLTLRAPLSPMKNSDSLSRAIRTEMLSAGVQSPSMGAHCFRHGFVSRMLKQGESLKKIADLIGHKHIQTTFIYTKIDFKSLAEVALELPEVENENN